MFICYGDKNQMGNELNGAANSSHRNPIEQESEQKYSLACLQLQGLKIKCVLGLAH